MSRHRPTGADRAPVPRRRGLTLCAVLALPAFAVSCGLPDGTPLPDIGDTIHCTFESGHAAGGEVTDVAPGAVQIGSRWVNWEMVESWSTVDPHESGGESE